jgi:hypothetical protein
VFVISHPHAMVPLSAALGMRVRVRGGGAAGTDRICQIAADS